MTLSKPTTYKVEDVNTRMTVKCEGRKGRNTCGDLPTDKRLKVTIGVGRFAKTEIFCESCGQTVLAELHTEIHDLQVKLIDMEGME